MAVRLGVHTVGGSTLLQGVYKLSVPVIYYKHLVLGQDGE